MRTWSHRIARLSFWASMLVPLLAIARGGGGEHYQSGDRHSSPGGGGGGGDGEMVGWILLLLLQHPQIMCPLLVIGGIVYFVYQRNLSPTATTQRAFEQREAELR